ncbi:hypothetical protein [Serinicoccus kebangsaanensis]|uniref:hypothetical protein n=1 Tax=Serinicoccus kebangsaanensis TaxID=2602069 RepID=UPI00124F6E61|nr:hypothetical protein [Serinicoccus kebangsaanensis]
MTGGPQSDQAQARGIRHRHGSYTGLRVVGGVVTAVLVAGAGISSVPGMLRQSDTAVLDLPDDVDRVVVQSPRGDVELRELRDGEQARVDAELHWSMARPELGLLDGPDDGSVVVQAPCNGGNMGQCSASFSLVVPPGTDVEVVGGFGDIDIDTTGTVEARGTGGDLRVSGEPTWIELNSTMGDVTIEGLGAPPPELIRVNSTMGDVTVTLPPRIAYAVSTQTDLGDDPQVSVARDRGSPYVVDIETTMGSIDVANPTPASGG